MTTLHAIAVIVDISKSRAHADRSTLQTQIQDAFGRVNEILPGLQRLEPTFGDEFQAVYADVPTALRATLLARLQLPDGVDCRFGLGEGELRTVGAGVAGAVQDGSAWWSARRAIDEAREHQYSKLGFVRTWFRRDGSVGEGDGSRDAAQRPSAHEALVNAYLLARDQILATMTPRARRLLLGQLRGATQAQLAAQEGITQSAVSQSLSRSGANALVAGEALLNDSLTPGGDR
jgi:hypothetical protein